MSNKAWRTATQLVHGGIQRSAFDENCEGLFLTSGYIYKSAEEQEATFKEEIKRYQYSRFANPTTGMFEERMAMIEGANYCLATATGMSAVYTAMMAQLKSGDRIIASRALFGSSLFILNNLMPRYGIEVELVDGDDLNQWEQALNKPTRVVLLETPSNPTLDIVDIQGVCDLAHKVGARVIVDNVFATPVLQKPLEFGADVVVYSTTKYVDVQGRTMGGAILFNDEALLKEEMMPFFRNTGPAISPFNAWTQLKGLETMDIRVMKHSENATLLARFLEKLTGVRKVHYPGLQSHAQHKLAMKQMRTGGPMLSFEIDGDKATAFAFENALKLIKICNNLGDSKSLITHPATTTHSKVDPAERDRLNITDGLLRLSVGLEDTEDLKEDLAQAAQAVFG